MQAITLTDAALAHLKKMRSEVGGDELLLRVGVKQVRASPPPCAMPP
jgi:Fe-S cluster assembly iron-binding protein IscA